MLISTEAQANGGCIKERAANKACGDNIGKGGSRTLTIYGKPIRVAVGSPIVISQFKMPVCLWDNYRELRKYPKYQHEGKPSSWRANVDEKDLTGRCPNTSFTETAARVGEFLQMRAELSERRPKSARPPVPVPLPVLLPGLPPQPVPPLPIYKDPLKRLPVL
jgi:hypothetical protein